MSTSNEFRCCCRTSSTSLPSAIDALTRFATEGQWTVLSVKTYSSTKTVALKTSETSCPVQSFETLSRRQSFRSSINTDFKIFNKAECTPTIKRTLCLPRKFTKGLKQQLSEPANPQTSACMPREQQPRIDRNGGHVQLEETSLLFVLDECIVTSVRAAT